VGGGSSADFIDVPVSDGSEAVSAESQKLTDEEIKQTTPKKESTKSATTPAAASPAEDSTRRKRSFLQKVFGKKNGQ
jgi:hypothetical protein